MPAFATPLIGREREIAATCGVLRGAEVRLLTLTGAAGVGKTRIAVQVAAEVADEFGDGAFFVSLGSLGDHALVPATVAQAIGLREQKGEPPLVHLKRVLWSRRLLLVLDNFEHLLPAASAVAELLAECPLLKILATSRASLRLSAEHELPIEPLPLPDLGALPEAGSLGEYPAIDLFVQRSKAVRPDFELTDANGPAVAEICVRLDGLPLAIELAAAQVKLIPPQAMVGRLEPRLALLTGGPRDAPGRHQTLRNAISWSYELLPPTERRLFERLSVFAGGFTLEAAEAVASAPGDLTGVRQGLMELVNDSLVRSDTSLEGEPHLTMLETIREFARERLEEREEDEDVRRAHASSFLTLAEEAGEALMALDPDVWVGPLEREHDNLRTSLRWFLEHREGGLAVRLAGALWRFWLTHGHIAEGRRWLEEALAAGGAAAPVAARANALNGAGVLAHYQSDYGQAEARCRESLSLYRSIGDRRGVSTALDGLALPLRTVGDHATARALYEEALAIARDLGDEPRTAFTLERLASCLWFAGEYEAARTLCEESLELSRRLGRGRLIGNALLGLGVILLAQGEGARARPLLEEALGVFRELGDRWSTGRTLISLGRVALAEDDRPRATMLLEQGLGTFAELGDRFLISGALVFLAELAAEEGRAEEAGRLVGAAERLRDSTGGAWPLLALEGRHRVLAAIAGQLTEEEIEAALAEGGAMTPEQAIQAGRAAARSLPARPAGILTGREREVLLLVADGLSDAAIADRLVVSPRTVHAHLRSIYRKLGVSSRKAAAGLAARLESP